MAEVVAKTKGAVWKYFGAMMMEEKGGKLAISYTRALGVVLFTCCLVTWMGGSVSDVPDGMLYTLWGLIGIKGAKDLAKGLGGAGW